MLVQGGGGSRDGLKLHATMLAEHGYGVPLYDERGRGASGGRSDAFGWDWAPDVSAAVSFLRAGSPGSRASSGTWMRPHTKGLATHPAVYERHVLGLFDSVLLRVQGPARDRIAGVAAGS